MPDINKLIATEHMTACEAAEVINDMGPWTESQARELAREDGLDLTEAHLEVLCWLRDYYADCGGPPARGHSLAHALEAGFADRGGKRYLFKLFPHGPVMQGCRLAGLTPPPGTADRSFGSVH